MLPLAAISPSSALAKLAPDLRGQALLETPWLNKGTAFTTQERQALGLDGLIPPVVETIEEQSARAYKAYLRKHDNLERHIYLRQLQDTNEVLFYRLLHDHIEEMLPIVYLSLSNTVRLPKVLHSSTAGAASDGMFLRPFHSGGPSV